MNAEQLKHKYISSGERLRGARREQLAEPFLQLLFHRQVSRGTLSIARTGIGVGSAAYTPRRYTGIADKFDYALVSRSRDRLLYVEVTGTPYTRGESAGRFGQAMIAILPDKQKLALEAWSIGIPVYYMIIAEAEGKLRFISPQTVEEHARPGYWAQGEKPYLLLPWRQSMMSKPYQFRRAAQQILRAW